MLVAAAHPAIALYHMTQHGTSTEGRQVWCTVLCGEFIAVQQP